MNVQTQTAAVSMRDTLVATVDALLEQHPRLALVLAEISADRFAAAAQRHPRRVVNVGIREQLMISVAAGMALEGMRPIVHSYAPFVVERPFEQLKLDLVHQEAAAIVVSIGASYDASAAGRTHQSPGDVALISTLPGFEVHVPGHAAEVRQTLEAAVLHDRPVYIRLAEQTNTEPYPTGKLHLVHEAASPSALVLAVGPMLDRVRAATRSMDVSLLYTSIVRPWASETLRQAAAHALASSLDGVVDVVLVEPYLAGTSSAAVAEALQRVPHRLLALGVQNTELRRYGTPADHDTAHGLDQSGLRRSIEAFVGGR